MLGLNLLGHVHRVALGHLRNDHVAGIVLSALDGMRSIVVEESVQTGANELGQVGIILGLVGVGIPVGAQRAHGILIGVGSVRCRSGSRRFSALGGIGAGSGGIRRLLGTAGEGSHDHGQYQQQCKCLLHFVTSLLFPMKADPVKGPNHSLCKSLAGDPSGTFIPSDNFQVPLQVCAYSSTCHPGIASPNFRFRE